MPMAIVSQSWNVSRQISLTDCLLSGNSFEGKKERIKHSVTIQDIFGVKIQIPSGFFEEFFVGCLVTR